MQLRESVLKGWTGICVLKGGTFTVGHKMQVNILGLAMIPFIRDIILK